MIKKSVSFPGQASFKYDLDLKYKVDVFCTYPVFNKTFFGQLKLSPGNKTEWRAELKCLTNEESITCE